MSWTTRFERATRLTPHLIVEQSMSLRVRQLSRARQNPGCMPWMGQRRAGIFGAQDSAFSQMVGEW